MSVKARVGTASALGAAAGLVLVAALTQAGGHPQTGADGGPSVAVNEAASTFVPLEGIAPDEPADGGVALPATDEDGRPIAEEPAAGAPPAPGLWTVPEAGPAPAPYAPSTGGNGDGGTRPSQPDGSTTPTNDGKAAPDAKPRPDGAASGAATAPPQAGTAEEPSAEAGATESSPPDAASGATPDAGTVPGQPVPQPSEAGAVDGVAAPETPAESLPPTDVLEGIVPPPADLLPPPPPVTPTPAPTPTPTPSS